jgi:hypothetical protein
MSDTPRCSWCDRLFRPRQSGGRAQRFCRPRCRRAFHCAARAWALDAIARGALTIADIKNGFGTTRALLPGTISPAPALVVPRQGAMPQALAYEAAQQEGSREIPAKICAAKNPSENSEENLAKPPAQTLAR